MDLLVVAAFVLTIMLEFAVPVALGWWLVRRFGLSWKVFAYGAGFFVLVQLVHAPLVILLQGPVVAWFTDIFAQEWAVIAALAIVLGLLAGLFEEIGRWLVFTRFFPRKEVAISRENGVLFGAGWGGVECILVGLLVLLTFTSYLMAPATLAQLSAPDAAATLGLNEEQLQLATYQLEVLMNLAPVDVLTGLAERMMTVTLHIAFSLMVLAAVLTARKMLLAAAIAAHAIVDALVVFTAQMYGILVTELILFVFALIALAYIRMQWRALGNSAPQ